MEAAIKRRNLVITLPLEVPRPSGSGKTLVIASSRGTQRSTARYGGKVVCVNVNAFVYPDPSPETTASGEKKKRT
jgi:hypothetical protein